MKRMIIMLLAIVALLLAFMPVIRTLKEANTSYVSMCDEILDY